MKDLSKIFIIISLFLLVFNPESHAQKEERGEAGDIRKNAAFVELGGNAVGISFNYSRILLQKERTKLAVRGGVGNLFTKNLSLPFEISVLYGKRHHFETGPGVRFGFDFYKSKEDDGIKYKQVDTYQSFTFRAGYRYEQYVGESKFFASAGVVLNVTPGVSILGSENVPIALPLPSAAIGMSF